MKSYLRHMDQAEPPGLTLWNVEHHSIMFEKFEKEIAQWVEKNDLKNLKRLNIICKHHSGGLAPLLKMFQDKVNEIARREAEILSEQLECIQAPMLFLLEENSDICFDPSLEPLREETFPIAERILYLYEGFLKMVVESFSSGKSFSRALRESMNIWIHKSVGGVSLGNLVASYIELSMSSRHDGLRKKYNKMLDTDDAIFFRSVSFAHFCEKKEFFDAYRTRLTTRILQHWTVCHTAEEDFLTHAKQFCQNDAVENLRRSSRPHRRV